MTDMPDRAVVKRPEVWLSECYPGMRVLDADGWRNPIGKPWSMPITREEFEQRLAYCTVEMRPQPRAVVDDTPFIVTHSVDTYTEKQLGAFASERVARNYTRRWSKRHHGICVLRGPIEEDEYGQTFVLAIFDNGEEIEDCDHS